MRHVVTNAKVIGVFSANNIGIRFKSVPCADNESHQMLLSFARQETLTRSTQF